MGSATKESREQMSPEPASFRGQQRPGEQGPPERLPPPRPYTARPHRLPTHSFTSHSSSKGRFNPSKPRLPQASGASVQWQSSLQVLTLGVQETKPRLLSDYWKWSDGIQSSNCRHQWRAGCSHRKMSFPANTEPSSVSYRCADPRPNVVAWHPAKTKKPRQRKLLKISKRHSITEFL